MPDAIMLPTTNEVVVHKPIGLIGFVIDAVNIN
jgi:hypothetical protein